MITSQRAFKLAKMYFDNVLAISNDGPNVENGAAAAAENFVEIAI